MKMTINNNAVISNIKNMFPELNETCCKLGYVPGCDFIVSLCGSLCPKAKLCASSQNQLASALKIAISSCCIQNQCNLCSGCGWVTPI